MLSFFTTLAAALVLFSNITYPTMPSRVGETVTDPCGLGPGRTVRIHDRAEEAENIHLLARDFLIKQGLPKYLVCDFGQRSGDNISAMAELAVRRTEIYSDDEMAMGRHILRSIASINLDHFERTILEIEQMAASGDYDAATSEEMRELVRTGRRDIVAERARLATPSA